MRFLATANKSTVRMDAEMTEGWVYVATNPSMPGLAKIGFTVREPTARVAELSQSTGVPTPFKLEYAEHVVDCREAESAVHRELRQVRRSKDREFFELSARRAAMSIAAVCEPLRTERGKSFVEAWIRQNGRLEIAPLANSLETHVSPTRIFQCPGCRSRLRIPRTTHRYELECPRCGYRTLL